jgi:hypothetical protein
VPIECDCDCITPCPQGRAGSSVRWPLELVIVDNKLAPEVPLGGLRYIGSRLSFHGLPEAQPRTGTPLILSAAMVSSMRLNLPHWSDRKS